MMDKQCYVYLLARMRNGTLQIGIPSDLVQRVWYRKNTLVEGFSQKYYVDKIVYYEIYEGAQAAIVREKQLKKWRRAWKLRLIEEKSPGWQDLYDDVER